MSNSILIVDDELGIRETLAAVLSDEGFETRTAASGEDALEVIKRHEFDLMLLDVWLPQMDGIETLQRVHQAGSNISVIMISGHATIDTAVRATKLGAIDFIEKPFEIEKLIRVVRHALRERTRQPASEIVKQLEAGNVLIGDSVAMRALRGQIAVVAPTDGRVLITGESGTGKELVARALHAASRRSDKAFVEMNCAAIPEDLIESELFGHTRGAFTGATSARQGKFELAHEATLFLDEVADMSARVQAKVLRVLEESKFQPVGSNTLLNTDARIIAATNKRLDEAITEGGFRADLFYRLHVIPFEVPPLREHLEDVPQLVAHFNQVISNKHHRAPKHFHASALDKLSTYAYPGNVRELRNLIERVLLTLQKDEVRADDIPLPALTLDDHAALQNFRFPSFKDANDAYMREFIRRKIAEANGNVSKAAEAMGVDRSHLYRRMKALNIKARDE